MLLYPITCRGCRREIRLTDRQKCVMRAGAIVSCPQCKVHAPPVESKMPFTLTASDMRFLRTLRIRPW